jgi:hypothetical protein
VGGVRGEAQALLELRLVNGVFEVGEFLRPTAPLDTLLLMVTVAVTVTVSITFAVVTITVSLAVAVTAAGTFDN